jgi:SulP family sulfate permease
MSISFFKQLKREFSGYNAQTFQQDLLSAVTVTAVALPLALAFGVSGAGSASAGLITAIIAGVAIGALSGGSFQISGPTGAMSAILVVILRDYGMQGVWVAGALSGVLLILAALFKLGRIVSYIPTPVVTGFTSGIAVIIAVGQIDNFLGIHTAEAESSAVKLLNYFRQWQVPSLQAVGLALSVVAVMLLWPKKWNRYAPSSLVGLIVSLAASLILKLDVAVIGEIPKTLLPEARLSLSALNFETLKGLLVPAVSIGALGMIESLLCGRVGGNMRGEKLDDNQELFAQGVGNIIIPFFGGLPATAAIARTSVAIKSGGRTRLVSIMHAMGIMLSMFVLAPVMSRIPLASLAGILMVTAWRMNEWENIRFMFSKRLYGAVLKFFVTMAATVLLDLTQAIIIGVVFSGFLFMLQITGESEVSIQEVDGERLAAHGINVKKLLQNVKVAYLTGPIFFATVENLTRRISGIQDGSIIILSMRGVPLVDTSGLQALRELNIQLKERSCALLLSGLQKNVEQRLFKSGLIDEVGRENIFWSADEALKKYLE